MEVVVVRVVVEVLKLGAILSLPFSTIFMQIQLRMLSLLDLRLGC